MRGPDGIEVLSRRQAQRPQVRRCLALVREGDDEPQRHEGFPQPEHAFFCLIEGDAMFGRIREITAVDLVLRDRRVLAGKELPKVSDRRPPPQADERARPPALDRRHPRDPHGRGHR